MEIRKFFDRLRSSFSTGNDDPSASRYRGVQINAVEADCCTAVREINGRRFLSHDVPRVPLGGCDVAKCRCTYELFEDRRTGMRRNPQIGAEHAYQLRTLDERSHPSFGRRRDDKPQPGQSN